MAKRPRISVTERNQQTAAILDSDPRYRKGINSPFGIASAGIQLRDPSKVARWFNSAVMADHVWRKKEVGYDPVTPDELLHPDQAGAFNTSADGYVVRGERGQEVLMSIPRAVWDARQLAKAEKNFKDMKDWTKEKESVLNATAARFGAEAADYVNDRTGPVGSIKTYGERIEVREEEE